MLDRIANGQVILFIKHCKVNLVRCIEDKIFEDVKNKTTSRIENI